MSYRAIPVNAAYGIVDGTARALGLETKVELSDHSITVEYALPDVDTRAWDSNLYVNGNVFVDGYANPIKPKVNYNEELENPDTIDVEEGETGTADDTADSEEGDGPHVSLISSARYRDYMRQDLVSQLLTPNEQWKLLAYGILGVAILQFFTIIITMWATGQFA